MQRLFDFLENLGNNIEKSSDNFAHKVSLNLTLKELEEQKKIRNGDISEERRIEVLKKLLYLRQTENMNMPVDTEDLQNAIQVLSTELDKKYKNVDPLRTVTSWVLQFALLGCIINLGVNLTGYCGNNNSRFCQDATFIGRELDAYLNFNK